MSSATRVVYIAGAERSGTTILGNVLATATGAEHVGELEYLGKSQDIAGQQCGCAQPIGDCPFWREVIAYAGVDLARWQSLRKATTRMRHVPQLLYALKRHGVVFEYADLLNSLYCSIGERGIKTVIDSSKRAVGALSCCVAPDVESYVVHVVRDPRAVSYSRAKRTKRHGSNGEGNELVRRSVMTTSRQWLACNSEIEILRHAGIPKSRYRLVRYEDLMSNPRFEFQKLASWLGLESRSLTFRGDNSVALRQTHTVKGNPNRFSTGDTKLELDEQWRDGLTRGERGSCVAVCSPLLRRYGYSLLV